MAFVRLDCACPVRLEKPVRRRLSFGWTLCCVLALSTQWMGRAGAWWAPSGEDIALADTSAACVQRTEPLRVQSRVTLEGRTIVGDQPAPGIRLRLRHVSGAGQAVDTTTDRSGRFRVSLSAPGEYSISVRSLPYFSTLNRRVQLPEGRSEVTVVIPDTRILLRVKRFDAQPPSKPVQVHVFREQGSVLTEVYAGVLAPSDAAACELFGVEPGSYRLAADLPGLAAIAAARVVVVEHRPTRVELKLAPSGGALSITDPSGAAIRGGRVTSGATQLEMTGVGSFSMDRISTGSPLLVDVPGFVPQCLVRVGPDGRTTRLTKSQHSLTLQFTGLAGNAPVGNLEGLPGSDCAVPLALLAPASRREGGVLSVTLSGLVAGVFRYRAPGSDSTVAVTVPGPPLAVTIRDLQECFGARLPIASHPSSRR